MTTRIEIDRHAPAAHRAVGLRSPRGTGLTVTARRLTEDPFQIVEAGLLAAVELGDAVIPAQFVQVLRRRGLSAVIIGVVADLVFLERVDHVRALALLQGARLLADHLERRPNLFA